MNTKEKIRLERAEEFRFEDSHVTDREINKISDFRITVPCERCLNIYSRGRKKAKK